MVILFIFVLLLSCLLLSTSLFKKKKNLPPSPLALPIIGHLHLLKKPLPQTLQALSARYGPILYLRFGFIPVLVISSPSAVEECFTKNDIPFANRPPIIAAKHLGHDSTTLEWAPYGHHWRHLRRIANLEVFSPNSLLSSSGIRNEEVRHMIGQLLRSSSDEGFREVDLKLMFFQLTFNVIMRMVAGKRYFGGEMTETGMEEARQSREMLKEIFFPSTFLNMLDFLPFLRWIGYVTEEKKLLEMKSKRDGLLQALIDERRKGRSCKVEGQNNQKTLIDVLLSMQEAEEPEFYSDEVIKGFISFMFTAGTETSNATLEGAMSLMLSHPGVLARARAELELHVGQTRLVQDSDLPKLPYLHCIINETLRLRPPAPIPLPHYSSEECTVGGYEVPRGTTLLVNAWAIHRDPEIWVEPTRFKPERFEGVAGEKEGFNFKLLPFGSGRRGCPGSGLALRTVALILGGLIQCFDWEVLDMIDEGATHVSKAKFRPCQTTRSVLGM